MLSLTLVFTRLLPRIGAIMKPDTLKEWTMFFEFNCKPSFPFVLSGNPPFLTSYRSFNLLCSLQA